MNIEFIEQETLKKITSVFDFAYIHALENDLNVMKIEDGSLYEVDSDGNKTFIKNIKQHKVVQKKFSI